MKQRTEYGASSTLPDLIINEDDEAESEDVPADLKLSDTGAGPKKSNSKKETTSGALPEPERTIEFIGGSLDVINASKIKPAKKKNRFCAGKNLFESPFRRNGEASHRAHKKTTCLALLTIAENQRTVKA
jgi:hypothetical protein